MSRTYRKRLTASAIVLMLTAALCVQSCRSNRTATKESEAFRSETLTTNRLADTVLVIVRDSIVMKEKPDTVVVERWRVEWRERVHRDTVVKIERTTDTVVRNIIQQPTEHANREGRPIGWGMAAWLGVLVAAGYFIIRKKN